MRHFDFAVAHAAATAVCRHYVAHAARNTQRRVAPCMPRATTPNSTYYSTAKRH